MKKRGIINAQLAGLIAGLGHKDAFMIGDGGMPIPKGVEIVDLALCGGVQAGSPVDSFAAPEPGDMPGYEDPVIMAAPASSCGMKGCSSA